VLEIGKNSVSPSTMPMKAAFSSSVMSKGIPVKKVAE
jgi:hypothetical protein